MIDLRRLPAALGLGLPTALLAHEAAFGGQHAAGGALHGSLLTSCAGLVAGALVTACALAWSGARATADGSILATRLRRFAPTYPQLLIAAWAIFGLIEWVEPHHGQPFALLALPALALATWLICTIASRLLRLLAAIAVAIAARELRTPAPTAFLFLAATPMLVRAPLRGRLVARPPPIA